MCVHINTLNGYRENILPEAAVNWRMGVRRKLQNRVEDTLRALKIAAILLTTQVFTNSAINLNQELLGKMQTLN